MRIVILLVVIVALAGCGKKKAPQSPGSGTDARELKQDVEMKETNAADDADDAKEMRSSDPQEGGE
jgi:hypothetical protein